MELFIAVENEDVPSINEIVKRIDINTIREKFTPFTYAAYHGKYKSMRALLDNGADIDKQDRHPNSALSSQIDVENVETMKFLFDNGANINKPLGILHYAVSNLKFESVKFLIENGANIDSTDIRGDTPLALATRLFKSTHNPKFFEMFNYLNIAKQTKGKYHDELEIHETKTTESEKKITKLKSEVINLGSEVLNSQTEIFKLQTENKNLFSINKNLRNENINLVSENKNLQTEAKSDKKRVQELVSEISSFNKSLVKLQTENKNLILESKSNHILIEYREKRVQELVSDISSFNKKLVKLQTENKNLKTENINLVLENKKNISDGKTRVNELVSEIVETKKSLLDLIKKTDNEVSSTNHELVTRLNELESKYNKCISIHSEKESEISSLEDELIELREEIQTRENESSIKREVEMSAQYVMTLEDYTVSEFLKQEKTHIAFIMDSTFIPVNKENIQFEENQFYECNQSLSDKIGPRLVGLRRIGGYGYLLEDDMEEVMVSTDNVHILEIIKRGQSFISEEGLDDDTDSAIHCQSGSPDNIYKISRSFRL